MKNLKPFLSHRLATFRRQLQPGQLHGEAALKDGSPHLTHLKMLFGSLEVDRTCQFGRDLVLLAFTNRCGSTYLGQLLASAPDLYGFREDLNHHIVKRRVNATGARDFTAYMQHITGLHSNAQASFGLKASAEQLRLVRLSGVDQMFNKTSVVRIRRRDRVAQAVSLWIARETWQWTSNQDAKFAELKYDHRTLRRQLDGIQAAETALDLVLSLLPYKVTNVEYEDLIQDRSKTIQAIRQELGLAPCTTPLGSQLKQQSSAKKTALTNRFREDLSREWSLPTTDSGIAPAQTLRVMKTECGSST